MSHENCIICGLPAEVIPLKEWRRSKGYECPRCGRFVLAETCEQSYRLHWLKDRNFWSTNPRIGVVSREIWNNYQTLHRITRSPCTIEEKDWQALLQLTPSPISMITANVMRYLSSDKDGNRVPFSYTREDVEIAILKRCEESMVPPSLYKYLFSDDANFMLGLLRETQVRNADDFKWFIVEYLSNELKYIGVQSFSNNSHRIKITPKGWEFIEKLESESASSSGKAFLAMGFGMADRDAYVESVQRAARAAGYEIFPADEVPHNDFIMNKVLNLIDEARFVIADLTTVPEMPDGDKMINGVRGGVYYEAGYARGKRKQVIQTCRFDDDSRKRLHFDVQQISTLFWENRAGALKTKEDDFCEILKDQIIATVGKGPLL